jgi:hypothetical protein
MMAFVSVVSLLSRKDRCSGFTKKKSGEKTKSTISGLTRLRDLEISIVETPFSEEKVEISLTLGFVSL